MRTLGFLVVLAAFSSPGRFLSAQAPPWWWGSFDKGVQEAADRNVPVVIVVIQDDEEANERVSDTLVGDKGFAKACEHAVAFICSKKDHGLRKEKKGPRKVCKRFGGIPCAMHIAHEQDMFLRLFVGKPVKTPQVLVCTPELKVVKSLVDVWGASAYVQAIRAARKKMGPGFTREEYVAAKRALAQAKTAVKRKDFPRAYRLVEDIVAHPSSSNLVKAAQKVQKQVVDDVGRAIQAAEESISEPVRLWTTLEILLSYEQKLDGTPLGKSIDTALRKLGRNRNVRATLARIKKQARLAPLYEKARAHEKKGRYIEARKAYLSVRRKAKGLPLADRALDDVRRMESVDAIRKLFLAEAKRLLERALALKKEGKDSQARRMLRKVVKDFEGLPPAEAAAAYLL